MASDQPAEIIIRGEAVAERPTSDEILRQAYGRDDELRLAAALRVAAEFNPNLSIVAANGGELLGYALYSRVTIIGSTGVVPAAALAVLGVRPERRKLGVGERLVRHGLERCRGLGVDLVFAMVRPDFFARLGFRAAVPEGLTPDLVLPSEQFSVFDLNGSRLGRVKGTVSFPAAFRGS